MPMHERLRRLRHHQQEWSSLAWNREIDVIQVDHPLYELCGNTLAQGTSDHSIEFLRIPSSLRNIPSTPPWNVVVDFQIRDFMMDPSANLLVLIEVYNMDSTPPGQFKPVIHLRALSSAHGDPHPCAKHPQLSLDDVKYYDAEWSYTIQIQGHFLGILLTPPAMDYFEEIEDKPRLVIWNWRTGVVFTSMVYEGLQSFVFLDDQRIMFAHIRSPTGWPALTIADFCTPNQEPMLEQQSRNRQIFSYPPLHSQNRVYEMNIRTDAASSWIPPADQTGTSGPFHIGEESRIYVVSIWMFTDAIDSPTVQIITRSELLKHASLENLDVPCETTHTVSWEEWGPHGSRIWTNEVVSDDWIGYAYGTRWIHPRFRPDESGDRRPGFFACCCKTRQASDKGSWYVLFWKQSMLSGSIEDDAETIGFDPVVKSRIFHDDVVTSLPYVQISRLLPQSLHRGQLEEMEVMISEDAIILIDAPHSVDQPQIKLLIF